VVIPSYNARATIRRCLGSVFDQDCEARYEVIVVDSSGDGTDEIIRREFPQALLFHLERRTPAGDARNLGMDKAAGAFMAFTDADCMVARDWLSRILKRHQGGAYAAVGGSIANGTPWSPVGSAEHLFAFNEFLPQAIEGLVTNIPTCNICYRRSALTGVRFKGGPDGVNLAEDLILNWSLVRRGRPRLRRYLEARKDVIAGRHCAQKNPSNWYRTIDRITPVLASIPKLLIPDIKGEAHIVFERGELYPHHNLYYVTSEAWDLRALQAVLLSSVTRLFVATYSTKMRGGYLRFQAQYLRRIRIPYWHDVSETLRNELIEAAGGRDLEACNRAAFTLYGLSHEERSALGGNGE